MSDPVAVTVGCKDAMEAADITTIMDNDCQQRMAVGAAMVMVGSDLAAKTTN
jgi:hypothetical protein